MSEPEIQWRVVYRYGLIPVKLCRATISRDRDGTTCCLTMVYVSGEEGGDVRERPETLPEVASPAGLHFTHRGTVFAIMREDWTVEDPARRSDGSVIAGELGGYLTIYGADPLVAQQQYDHTMHVRTALRAQADLLPKLNRDQDETNPS